METCSKRVTCQTKEFSPFKEGKVFILKNKQHDKGFIFRNSFKFVRYFHKENISYSQSRQNTEFAEPLFCSSLCNSVFCKPLTLFYVVANSTMFNYNLPSNIFATIFWSHFMSSHMRFEPNTILILIWLWSQKKT